MKEIEHELRNADIFLCVDQSEWFKYDTIVNQTWHSQIWGSQSFLRNVLCKTRYTERPFDKYFKT